MKILITGAYGMLGSDLREVLSSNDGMLGSDLREVLSSNDGMLGSDLREVLSSNEIIATSSKDLDITDKEKVLEFVKDNSPEIIINAAAYTAVDDCESHYEDAYQVNAIGPRNLALACRELDIPLIHISTDYVFDGQKRTPLLEDDKLGPKSAYGRTKLDGEKYIMEVFDKYFILRTAWLYGLNGSNFVKTMLDLTEDHDEVTVVNDQIGSPTYTHDLAMAISELLESDKYGIYHLTNSGECSWYEYCMQFYAMAGKDTKVRPVTSEEFPRPALRPHYSVLSNEKWIKAGFKPMRNYKEALKDYLDLIL